ncbi:MAG: glycosyltransferase family 2 protein [Anaerolineae bacterium]|nr:glycosyltransferase family 2 protein [Anaerolineales bacterium]MCQ3975140.1 glycosyltransferase family 2 protein [Anaerolineae bacterium]
MLDLSIVIVNYNTKNLLRDCLNSIYQSQGHVEFKVVVVDNASPDGSAHMVEAEFPQAILVASQINGGFAYANNLGLRQAGFNGNGDAQPDAPRYALLLNPDTVLPPTALADMITFMDAHPEAGAAGPKLVLPDGKLDLACRRAFPTPEVSFYRMVGLSKLFPHHRVFGRYNMTFADPDELIEVDSVVGAFMLVRREAIAQAGLLDETYFMYGEDLDWAYHIKACGWKIYYNPAVTVTHVKRAASRHSPKAQIEFYRAMDIFYRKFYAKNTPFWLHGLVVTGINLPWRYSQLKYYLANLSKANKLNQTSSTEARR